MPFKMHKIIYYFQKKNVPTLPKIVRPVTGNTLLFLFDHSVQIGIKADIVAKRGSHQVLFTLHH